jgi:hypothetical protein
MRANCLEQDAFFCLEVNVDEVLPRWHRLSAPATIELIRRAGPLSLALLVAEKSDEITAMNQSGAVVIDGNQPLAQPRSDRVLMDAEQHCDFVDRMGEVALDPPVIEGALFPFGTVHASTLLFRPLSLAGWVKTRFLS